VGATWGHRPHNFLTAGAMAPMESAPMIVALLCVCSAIKSLKPSTLFAQLNSRINRVAAPAKTTAVMLCLPRHGIGLMDRCIALDVFAELHDDHG